MVYQTALFCTWFGSSPRRRNLRGILLRANLHPLKYMLQEQPKEKDAPQVSGSRPWQAHVRLGSRGHTGGGQGRSDVSGSRSLVVKHTPLGVARCAYEALKIAEVAEQQFCTHVGRLLSGIKSCFHCLRAFVYDYYCVFCYCCL